MIRFLTKLFVRIRDTGVSNQGPEDARRLRTLNVITLLACIVSISYGAYYALYDVLLFWREIAFLLFIVLLYSVIFLITRQQHIELAMWTLVTLGLFHIGAISWMLGPRAGSLAYLIVIPFIVSLVTRQSDRLSIWPVAIAAGLIFVGVTFSAHEGSFSQLPDLTQRVIFGVNTVGAIALAVVVSIFFRWLIARAENKLQAEKARGDRLLRAILPDSIAERLKADEGRIIAESCESATILLADIVGFTQRSAMTDAGKIVADLNVVYSRMDELAGRHGLERIKTMGDGYLAVCGLPDPNPDHCVRTAEFALELQGLARELEDTAWPDLRFRTVVHAGPVVAGVIGRTKFAYDVWGDTVNTAARLEEVCDPGEILITDTVRGVLPSRFVIGAPRTVELRDKGSMMVFPLTAPEAALGTTASSLPA